MCAPYNGTTVKFLQFFVRQHESFDFTSSVRSGGLSVGHSIRQGNHFQVHMIDFKSLQNQVPQTITSVRNMIPNLGVHEKSFVIFQYWNGHRYMLLKSKWYTVFKALCDGQLSQKISGLYL